MPASGVFEGQSECASLRPTHIGLQMAAVLLPVLNIMQRVLIMRVTLVLVVHIRHFTQLDLSIMLDRIPVGGGPLGFR